MQEKDKAMKDFESFPDVAADIINVLVYEGKQIVNPDNLLPAPTETVYKRKNVLRNQYEDVEVYEHLDGKVNLLYLIANQSTVDYKMLFRKAGYVGSAYRNQYEGKLSDTCPVMQLVLYWGERHWEKARTMRQKFQNRQLFEQAWEYIDDMCLHVWELRYLSAAVCKRFTSDMRIVVGYLVEGNGYRSKQKVVHKEALINMIKSLSGDTDWDSTDRFLKEMDIKEEDEITMCELFDQYERRGREQGIQIGMAQGREEGVAQGTELGQLKAIQSIMNNLHLTKEEALEAADIPKAEWNKYESKLDVQH